MKENDNVFRWLEDWYHSNCNEDWEHKYGVTIESLDNPGWRIKIDLRGTPLEHEELSIAEENKGEGDWYSYSVKDSIYNGAGDPHKLIFLIEVFKKFIERRK
jgi:hypothetical protein